MWGIGAFLEWEDRKKLEEFMRTSKEIPQKLNMPTIQSDSSDTMYDFFVTNEGEWKHWKTQVSYWRKKSLQWDLDCLYATINLFFPKTD